VEFVKEINKNGQLPTTHIAAYRARYFDVDGHLLMSGNVERKVSQPEFDANLSLADFVVGDSDDPLVPPLAFTQWRESGAWEATLYEPELLATADARTTINYEGRPRSVINLCSYNYLGLANRPEVIAASREALAKYGLGACGSPLLSGMTDLHRQLERRVASAAHSERFLGCSARPMSPSWTIVRT